jgi:hypothetical protein
MATAEEKQELVEDIKRPVRYYRITLWGYGAEYTAGESTKEEYDYWVTEFKQRIKEFGLDEEYDNNPFETYMLEKDEDTKWEAVPEEIKRAWDYFEYNDIECIHGPTDNSARISIEEIEDTENVYQAKVIDTVVADIDFEEFREKYEFDYVIGESEDYKKEYIFTAVNSEKGTFFTGYIETSGRIDLSKLAIHATEIYDGDVIIHDIEYNSEYVDNEGAETNGKGTYINLVKT